ncbi:BQ5605_C028g10469 [Microbotryum silenes-dioicae]|uniref:BQ5605_C028g10469 protein n=1 Tax=Microbotryum silenes-dioicae TaxID=796604 RepID=A0A2X0MLX0_9BASI|nr:BQ5605_C028g10469 [Microbotryum silenes-dioicae]
MSKPSSLSLSPFSTPSPGLAHINRVIATTSGQDKVFMLYAYSSHVIMHLLRSKRLATRSRLELANRMDKLRDVISDARTLYRLFGLFPIIQWAQALNDPAKRPADGQLALINKLQAWSMLFYYPLEHYYYLAGKGVFDCPPARIGTIAMWACRFWASYVILQVLHIRREYQLLNQSRRKLVNAQRESRIAGGSNENSTEVEEIKRIKNKSHALKMDTLVQIGYLPLTAHCTVLNEGSLLSSHRSIPGGILPDNLWVGMFGTLAAATGLKTLWRNTA